MKHLQALSFLLLSLLLFSCTKDPVGFSGTDMRELVVPTTFDFSAVNEVRVSIYDTDPAAIYEIYSMNTLEPAEITYTAEDTIIHIDNSNQLLAKALINSGSWTETLQVPGYLDYIYLRRKAEGAYEGMPIKIEGGAVEYSHTGMKGFKSSQQGDADVLYIVNHKKELFSYDLESGEQLSKTALPKGAHACALDQANGQLYFLNYQKPRELFSLNLSSTEVATVGNLAKGHIRMAYNPKDGFIYLSNKKEVYSYDPDAGKYMTKYSLSGDSNKDGGGDICINADGDIFIVSKSVYKLTLDGNSNKATIVGGKLPQAVNGADFGSDGYIYAGKGNGWIYKIDPSTGSAEQIFNFKVTIGDITMGLKSGSQSQGDQDDDADGVANDSDDYPEDPNKAFNNYFPGQRSFGTLAFEDLWPSKGDYDFNDMVIDYRFNHIKNAQNLVVQLDITIQLRAIGGSMPHGFGIQLPVSDDQIQSVVTDFSFTGESITVNGKGLEANQNKATLIFFENGFHVLKHPGSGNGINTNSSNPYVEPAEMTLSVIFTEGLSQQEVGNAPNNPFIFSSNERGKEIHIPGYAPTLLVDKSYFGTFDDATNLDNNYYYKNINGLPWGMNIPSSFIYPVEKTQVLNGYLMFSQWATSGGYSFMDWYEEKSGYRNKANLFFKPN